MEQIKASDVVYRFAHTQMKRVIHGKRIATHTMYEAIAIKWD